MKKEAFTAVDLFAGAGGLSLAAKNIGGNVLAAVEINESACATYRYNFIRNNKGKTPRLYAVNILQLDPAQMLIDLNLCAGELDVLMGGPPCQGFSTHRIKDAGVDDARNLLLLRYFDFVRTLRPKIFIVENVPGLLWKRHENYLEKFYSIAKQNGYLVHNPVMINAKSYGVPQNRKRVFILGVRCDISVPCCFNWPPSFTHGNPASSEVRSGILSAWLTAKNVFIEPIKDGDENGIHMKPSALMVERFKQTPKNGGSRDGWETPLRCHKNHNGHRDVYGRIDPSKPGPTITSGCVNPSKGRFVHPTQNHGITIRHAARFQGFPDKFIFMGGLINGGVQAGNAVPIKLGESVLKEILKII